MWITKLWSIFGSIRTDVESRTEQLDRLDREAKNAVKAMDEQISLMGGRPYAG